MKKSLIAALILFLSSQSMAQDKSLQEIKTLQPSDQQVQAIFGLFLSKVPQMLSEGSDRRAQVAELAPQALQLLNPEQRNFLQQLAPQENLNDFQLMTESERKDFFFNAFRRLAHPSKRQWLDRMEEFTEPGSI